MARTHTNEARSPYYPPRARWYSPVFYLGNAIRRRLALDRIQLPAEMTFGGTLAGFLMPGLAVHLRGPRLWGKAALLGCAALLLCFLIGFGYPAGNLAFGLLLAVHATGFVYYCNPLLRDEELRGRLIFCLLSVVAIGLALYLPARNAVLQHWFLPLRFNGHVYVVQRQFPAAAVQRGDWVAYKLAGDDNSWGGGWGHGTIYLRSGLGFGPVLAVAGDRVGFSTNGFAVNGVRHALLPHMPQTGEVTLQEKQWFIWPELGISGHGQTPEGNISAMMLQLAVVSENDFVGKLCHRWLWRRQLAP